MRIAVVGVGGTGGYFGGLLARAGVDVTFITRGATLAALRERGLTVKTALVGDFTVPVHATDDPAAVGPVDLVLFCVKTYDTDAAATQIRSLIGPDTLVLSVQNGVDNEEQLGRMLGQGAIVGAIAQVSAQVEAPGVIVCKSPGPGILRFGELAGGVSARVERALVELQRGGFGVELSSDIRILLWEKFAFICALSGITSVTRLGVGSIVAHPETRELYRGVLQEVVAVGRARGVALPEDTVERWLGFSMGLNPAICGSMYYDLVAGRRLEAEALNGTVVRLGREHGVPTPLNFAIYAALKPHVNGTSGAP